MKAIVVLRPIAEQTDPDTNEVTRRYPQVPGSWDVISESDGWVTLYPLGRVERPDVFVHAWLAVESGANGAWVVSGQDSYLRQIYQSASNSWTISELRADDTQPAATIKALWKDDRERDADGNLLRPSEKIVAVRHTIFGFSQDADSENTTGLP